MPVKVNNELVVQVFKKELRYSPEILLDPEESVTNVTSNPNGTLCSILGELVYHPTGGNYYRCKETEPVEVKEMRNTSSQLIHRRTTISHNLNGATGTTPSSITRTWKVETIPTPTPVPTRTAYDLVGWNFNSSATSGLTFPLAIPENNSTLYAIWNAKLYTIRFFMNGAPGSTVTDTYTTESNKTFSSIAGAVSRNGYAFLGWKPTASGNSWDSNITYLSNTNVNGKYGSVDFNAQWSVNTYKITPNYSGGTDPRTPVLNWTEVANPGGIVLSVEDIPTGVCYIEGEYLYSSESTKYYQCKNIRDTEDYQITENRTLSSILGTPTRTGYTFEGWRASNSTGNWVNGTDYPTNKSVLGMYGNVTLTAQWLAQTPITVTYNANGGSGAPTATTGYAGTPLSLKTNSGMIRIGYQSLRWNTAANGSGTDYSFGTTATFNNSITLYAIWDGLNYTVTFNANSGTTPSPTTKSVKYGDPYGTLATTSRTGYTFAGWWTATSGGTQVTAETTVNTANNHTLYARWTANTYTVTFNANGGTTPSPTSKSVTYNSTYGTLATTSRNGYTFNGWFTATSGGTQVTTGTTVTATSNHSLYAQWTLVNYEITLNKGTGVNTLTINNSSYTMSTSSQTRTLTRSALPGFTLNVPTITRTGTYGGNTPTISSNTVTIPADSYGPFTVNQTATANSFNITLNPNEGTAGSVTAISVVYNTSISAWNSNMKPSRNGYTFLGFYTASSGGTQRINESGIYVALTNTTYTSATTLYAQWSLDTYSIVFDYDGGSGNAEFTSYTITTSKILASVTGTPTKSGYTFLSWKPTSSVGNWDSGTTYTGITNVNGKYGNVTLKAQWVQNAIVYYNANGGTSAPSSTSGYIGTQLTLATYSGTNNGYTALNWNTNSSGTGTNYNFGASYTPSASSTTLYVKWQLTTYTITVDRNGGTGGNSSATYNVTTSSTLATLLGTPTRTGYTLSGWKWTSSSAGGWTNGTSYDTSQNVNGKYASGTLQAQWSLDTYTITFNYNGGTGGASSTTYDITTSKTLASVAGTPTRTGYTFDGWKPSSTVGSWNSGTTYQGSTNVQGYYGTVTLVAQWTIISYTVTLVKNPGITTLTGLTSYSQSTSSQSFTMTRAKGDYSYYFSTPVITRTGSYGGSAPTVSGHTITGTTFTINIPANSYGTFTITQKAFVYVTGWVKVIELYNDEIDTYPYPTGPFIYGGYLSNAEEVSLRDSIAQSAIYGYFGSSEPSQPQGTVVTVYFEDFMGAFIFLIHEKSEVTQEVT